MGMNADVALALELSKRGFFDDIESVLDMGAQELHLSFEEFDWLVQAHGVDGYDPAVFANLRNYPGQPRCSAKPFWELLGVHKYTCTDIQDVHGAIGLDLNVPLDDKTHWGAYDLVTDFGNNEHAFNVGEAYRTMHRLCKPGGFMWITQGVYAGNGYYNFDEAFFEGMAAANGYGIVYAGYLVSAEDGQYHIPLSRALAKLLNPAEVELGVTYIFRKQHDADFKFAYQNDVESAGRRFFVTRFAPAKIRERYYIPQSIEWISGNAMARELWKRIRQRLGRH